MRAAVLKHWLHRPPTGYCPGRTLASALADFKGVFSPLSVETASAVLAVCDDTMTIEARECVERHFQMHVVSLEMTLTVAARVEPGIRIDIRNTGMLFRTGVACKVRAGKSSTVEDLSGMITGDPELVKALMVLDFRRCSLESSSEGWIVRIEPFGASEVVNRMPSFRRYIRLSTEQNQALLGAFRALRSILTRKDLAVPMEKEISADA